MSTKILEGCQITNDVPEKWIRHWISEKNQDLEWYPSTNDISEHK